MTSRSQGYKACGVPQCGSTTTETPDKLFVYVPNKPGVRDEWMARAKRDRFTVSSNIVFCEDHFDMPNDMINYMQYRIMGKVSTIRMKPGTMPTKFDCQKSGKRKNPNRQKISELPVIQVCKKSLEQSITKELSDSDPTSVPQEGFAVFIREEPPEGEAEDCGVRDSDSLKAVVKEEAVEPEIVQNTVKLEPADDDCDSPSTAREDLELDPEGTPCVKMEPADDEYDSPVIIKEDLELGPEEVTPRTIVKEEVGEIPDNEEPTPIYSTLVKIVRKPTSTDPASDISVTPVIKFTCASDFLSISLKELSPTESLYTRPVPDFEKVDLGTTNHQDFLCESAKRRLFSIQGCKEKTGNNVPKTTKGVKAMPCSKYREKKYECSVCQKLFSSKVYLKLHKRKHAIPNPYHCKICDIQLTNLSAFVDHKSTHVKEKRYTCKICGKVFKVFNKYKEHNILLHQRKKPFPCDICKRSFSYTSHLENHKKTIHAPGRISKASLTCKRA